MGAGAGTRAQGLADGAHEGQNMLHRRLPYSLIVSPLAAVALQLVLAAVAAAATGGGDFPPRVFFAVK